MRTYKEHLFAEKILSRMTDNCMNTRPRLVQKYARIFVRRQYLFQNTGEKR